MQFFPRDRVWSKPIGEGMDKGRTLVCPELSDGRFPPIAGSTLPLAIAIIEGIENRAAQGHYQVERFMFN